MEQLSENLNAEAIRIMKKFQIGGDDSDETAVEYMRKLEEEIETRVKEMKKLNKSLWKVPTNHPTTLAQTLPHTYLLPSHSVSTRRHAVHR